MYEIFVNYRRSQALAVAQLVARLRHHFGHDAVFLDLGMRSGCRYPDELRARIDACEVLLVMIHDRWLEEFDTPRVTDWVHDEIATALDMGRQVIPVLFDDVPMPTGGQLPAGIAELANRNAARIRAAYLTSDTEALIRRLELDVAAVGDPPGSAVEPERARTARNLIGWAALFALLMPVVFHLPAPPREFFLFPASMSAVLLVIAALGSTLVNLSARRLEARVERTYGPMSERELLARSWLLPAIEIIAAGYVLSAFMTEDGGWQEWEVWCALALTTTGTYFLHRSWRKRDLGDRSWPPPVSTEPGTFLRAAHRVHEKLTTDDTWRAPRSRAAQQQAASIYWDLAQVRLALLRRARTSLLDWLRHGYSWEVTLCLGWLASIVVLSVAALALLIPEGPATAVGYFALVPVVAALATAAKAVADWRTDRKNAGWKIAELTEWQRKLGPLIFGR